MARDLTGRNINALRSALQGFGQAGNLAGQRADVLGRQKMAKDASQQQFFGKLVDIAGDYLLQDQAGDIEGEHIGLEGSESRKTVETQGEQTRLTQDERYGFMGDLQNDQQAYETEQNRLQRLADKEIAQIRAAFGGDDEDAQALATTAIGELRAAVMDPFFDDFFYYEADEFGERTGRVLPKVDGIMAEYAEANPKAPALTALQAKDIWEDRVKEATAEQFEAQWTAWQLSHPSVTDQHKQAIYDAVYAQVVAEAMGQGESDGPPPGDDTLSRGYDYDREETTTTDNVLVDALFGGGEFGGVAASASGGPAFRIGGETERQVPTATQPMEGDPVQRRQGAVDTLIGNAENYTESEQELVVRLSELANVLRDQGPGALEKDWWQLEKWIAEIGGPEQQGSNPRAIGRQMDRLLNRLNSE